MKQGRTILFFLFALLSYNYSYCQYFTKGKVIDLNTREPLAFVNIVFNVNSFSGTITDIDGQFVFSSSTEIKKLTCSYVGYETKTVSLDSINYNDQLIIELQATWFQLQEVVVLAGDNPANRIIKKTIENKGINNPENISSFKYTSYNKVIYDLEPNDILDTTSIQIKKDSVLKGGHMLIMESVSERKFIAPGNNEEIILGTRISGFKDPSFAPLATDIQPFSFYNDIITIFDINYLNPISDGSLKKYQFLLEDTLFQNKDTTFIISFKPLPGKNYEALTGLLYINTNKYAIQNVIAKPFEKGFIDIKIQQKYQFIDERQWFPEQLNFEIIVLQYPSKEVGMSANGKSYIDNVELSADLNKNSFSLESVQLHEFANARDSLFWEKYRTEPLNEKERVTYHVIDSIGEKHKFNAKLRFFEKISIGKIPVKFIDIDISESLVYNKFEGYRLGLGAYTNEKLLKFLSIGGFFGYGLKDHQWKYGGELILNLYKEKELQISGKYQNTLLETGLTGLDIFSRYHYDLRRLLASQMDRIQQNSFAVSLRAIKYAKLGFSLNQTFVEPQYAYEYQPGDEQSFTDYTYSDVTVDLRYAYKEKLINSLNQRISMGTKYPVLFLTYSKGVKDFLKSEFDFNKIEARVEKSFLFKNLGETKFRIDAGFIDNPLPYGLLFTGEGSYDKSFPVLMKNYFQTSTPYEFLSNQYVNLFFSHNFGSLLFRKKKFKPHFTVYQNMGWGTLSNPDYHQLIEFKTKEEGFFESGLQIDNIIKLNYLNIAYIGFGAGVFYRYGPYAFGNSNDNFALRFSMTFATK